VYSYLTTERNSREPVGGYGHGFSVRVPIELGSGDWPQQPRHVQDYSSDAKSYGRDLGRIARSIGDSLHIRRETDRETKDPVLIALSLSNHLIKTFHAMRDVLSVIAGDERHDCWLAV